MLQMESHFRFISISHQTAPVVRRERYYLDAEQKGEMAVLLPKSFPDLSALLLLSTCNRTEIYFESESTSASELLHFLITLKIGHVLPEDQADFICSDSTGATVKHLLRVSGGLESSVLGDAEIIHQIKKAYHFSLEFNLQGSLLERSIQTVFRFHKRVSNETAFRDGTTSTAYKALKLIGDTFGQGTNEKKILLVGAGDIVRQLLKYNSKFGYQNLFITNRTEKRAQRLADNHRAQVWPWKKLLENDLSEFDVIISAVSNSSSLIHKGLHSTKQVLLVDLAIPGNIAPQLGEKANILMADLDSIASILHQNKVARTAASEHVNQIADEEWQGFMDWYHLKPLRELLAEHKLEVLSILEGIRNTEMTGWSEERCSDMANRIVRKLLKNPEALHNRNKIKEIVLRNLPLQSV